MMPKRLWIAGLSSLLGTGCSSGEALAPPAQQFDLSLRRAERELAARVPAPARAPARALLAPTPVDSGNVRTFKVCAVAVGCDARKSNTLASVTATALKVGQHIAIYVD